MLQIWKHLNKPCFDGLSMPLSEEEKIKATILYHLRRKKVIGGVHTHFDAVRKGFPSHWGKDVSNVAKELVKRGFLILKQAS